MNTEVIGMAAGFLTTIGFFPQVVKAIRTRSTGDLSILMILTLLTGVTLWFIYGWAQHDRPIFLANGFTGILLAIMLVLKLRFR